MKKFILILSLFLCACGPREIGGGRSPEPTNYGGASAADIMRYPMTGANRSEKMLYYYNKPEVMESVQQANRENYLRRMGITPEDPAYREIPKQKSPFRQ
ncbi:MAG: chemotaxis protein [Desulfovibrio sp.]|nr:chemotaxis protein [Desulfovibrio sp.]